MLGSIQLPMIHSRNMYILRAATSPVIALVLGVILAAERHGTVSSLVYAKSHTPWPKRSPRLSKRVGGLKSGRGT